MLKALLTCISVYIYLPTYLPFYVIFNAALNMYSLYIVFIVFCAALASNEVSQKHAKMYLKPAFQKKKKKKKKKK